MQTFHSPKGLRKHYIGPHMAGYGHIVPRRAVYGHVGRGLVVYRALFYHM